MNRIRHHLGLLAIRCNLTNLGARLLIDAAARNHRPSEIVLQHPSLPPAVRGESFARLALDEDQRLATDTDHYNEECRRILADAFPELPEVER